MWAGIGKCIRPLSSPTFNSYSLGINIPFAIGELLMGAEAYFIRQPKKIHLNPFVKKTPKLFSGLIFFNRNSEGLLEVA